MKNKISKIFNQMDVDKALNSAKLQKAKFNLNEKEVYKKITELNREAKAEKKLMFSGLIINLIIIIGLIASSTIICLAGLKVYKSHSIAFIISMLFVELVLFQSYYNATVIKQKFYRHYGKLKLMQYGLLIVLIYYNFSFFYSYVKQDKFLVVVTFILCFLVEFCIMNLASLSRDLKTLNYTYNDNSIDENTSIIKMILFNLTFKTRINALKQYKRNVKQYKNLNADCDNDLEDEEEQVFVKVFSQQNADQSENAEIETTEIKQIESAEAKTKEPLFEEKPLNLKIIEEVFKFIQENKKENIAPGIKKISDNTEIKVGEVTRIREELIKHGYLQPDKVNNKMQTLVVREKLNLEEFEREETDNESI